MRTGIILPNWIGDVVMATPALRAMREGLGADAHLVGIMRPYVAEVLSGTSWLDETIVYDRRSENPDLRSWALIRKLKAQQLDALVLLTNSLSTGAIAWLSRVPKRIGYVRYGRGFLLTDKLAPPRENGRLTPISAVDYYLQLTDRLGCPALSRRPELSTTAEEEAAADQVWRKLKLDRFRQVVVMNTGGAYGAAKRWPMPYFAQVARRTADELNAAVLVICGPAERETAAEIVRFANHPHVKSLADQPLSIGLSKACVRRSQLMLSTDSGPRHFAAAFGVPIVSLFGPTDPRWSLNYHPREICLQIDIACRPCAKRECPLKHHRCMNDLTPDEVFRALRHLFGQASRSQSAA